MMMDPQGGRVKNLYNTVDEIENADESEQSSYSFPFLQLGLLSSSVIGVVTVTILAQRNESWTQYAELEVGRLIKNIISAFFFFFFSDIVAQTYQNMPAKRKGKPVKLNYGEATRTGCLGIFLNGIGSTIWMHELNLVIPDHAVDGSSYTDIGHLMVKALLDSLLWGTISNTLGIIGRRLLEGDSPHHAWMVWVDKILVVTASELWFWPFWSAFNFYVVPKPLRVLFNSFGAFVWNCYLSYVAISEPVDSAPYHRISVVVDGHGSPTRTYILPSTTVTAAGLSTGSMEELLLDAEVDRHHARLKAGDPKV